jgi:hypothetical protein
MCLHVLPGPMCRMHVKVNLGGLEDCIYAACLVYPFPPQTSFLLCLSRLTALLHQLLLRPQSFRYEPVAATASCCSC